MRRTVLLAFILLAAAPTLSPGRPAAGLADRGLTERCAVYERPDRSCESLSLTFCARCGDGICEPFEICSSSGCGCIGDKPDLSVGACTLDCGPLHCPEDCEG